MIQWSGIAGEYRERLAEICGCLLAIVAAVSRYARGVRTAQIMLNLGPQVRGCFPREYGERRRETCDGLLLIVGGISPRTTLLSDSEVVLRLSPLRRTALARKDRQSCLEVGNRHLAIVSLVAA